MRWIEAPFGKYEGKTLPQIVLTDSDWFFWAVEERVFKSPALGDQAEEIARKAARILIPREDASAWKVEYILHYQGRLGDVRLVPADKLECREEGQTLRCDFFDLSFARRLSKYDKWGSKVIVLAVKKHIFGDVDIRLTRKRCEAFFDDGDNFAADGRE